MTFATFCAKGRLDRAQGKDLARMERILIRARIYFRLDVEANTLRIFPALGRHWVAAAMACSVISGVKCHEVEELLQGRQHINLGCVATEESHRHR
jgi:hypothetical protein